MGLIINTKGVNGVFYKGDSISDVYYKGDLVYTKRKAKEQKITFWLSEFKESAKLNVNKVLTESTFIEQDDKGFKYELDLQGVVITSLELLFNEVRNYVTEIEFSDGFDTSECVRFIKTFNQCTNLREIRGLDGLNVSKVEYFRSMFAWCSNLASVGDLSNWDMRNAKDISYMFDHCDALQTFGDISTWKTEKCTTLSYMYQSANGFSEVYFPQIGDGTISVGTSGIILNLYYVKIKGCGSIHNTLSLTGWNGDIESVKVVLRALSTPYRGRQDIFFKDNVKMSILADEEAWDLYKAKSAMGWNFGTMPIENAINVLTYNSVSEYNGYLNYSDTEGNTTRPSDLTPTPFTNNFTTDSGKWFYLPLDDLEINALDWAFYANSADTRLTAIAFPPQFKRFKPTSLRHTFQSSTSSYAMTDVFGLGNIDTSECVSLQSTFEYCDEGDLSELATWDVSKVESFRSTFINAQKIRDLSFLDAWRPLTKIKSMRATFDGVKASVLPDLTGWDTSEALDYTSFLYASAITTVKGLPQIGDGVLNVNTSTFINDSYLTTIEKANPIHNTLSFSTLSKLTLDSAIVILNALSTPYNGKQALTFSTATKTLVKNDPTAMAIVEAKRALGWTISL